MILLGCDSPAKAPENHSTRQVFTRSGSKGEVYITGETAHWSLTTLKMKLAKIDAKAVRHGHRLSDTLGPAGDQVDATGPSVIRGIDPVCPAS